jgi:hypothetical protein
MPKLLAIVFIVTLLCSSTNAQQVKFSQELRENRSLPYMKILGTDENENVFLLKSNLSLDSDRDHSGLRNREYYLQLLSPDLKVIWEKELMTSYENGHITDVQINNGKLVVVGYIFERKLKQYTFYIQAMLSDGSWQGTPVLIDQFLATQLNEDDKPGIVLSHDDLSMAFSYRKVSMDKLTQLCHVVVLDTTFSIQYKKDIIVQAPPNNYVPVSSVLTDDRSFFVLGTHYLTDKRVKMPGEVYYEINGYHPAIDRILHSEIKIENKFLTDVGFSVDNYNSRLIAAGFYSDKTTYSTAGIFYCGFSTDSLKQLSATSSPFSESYLMKFVGERKENKSKELVNYTIDRLIVRRDGGVALLAESFNRAERSYWDYYLQTYNYHYYYHYGNVMVCSVNPSGEILWGNVITKDQNSIDDGGVNSGYVSSVVNGKILSIYNKYVNDISSVLMTTIDGVGAQKTDVMINEIERVSILPSSAKQIDENSILIPAYKQNKFHLIKITF